MKKNFSLMIVTTIFIYCSLLLSCNNDNNIAGEISADELLNAAVGAYDKNTIPNTVIYSSSVNPIPDGHEGLLFKDEAGSEVPDLNYAGSYAMIVPKSYNVFEIDIVRVTSKSNVNKIKNLLQDRLNVKNNGNILNYTPQEQPYLDNAEIFNIGNYVILIATHDNSIAYNKIYDMLNNGGAAREAETAQTDETTTTTGRPQAAVSGNIRIADSIINVDIDTLYSPVINNDDSGLEKTDMPVLTVIKHTANTQIFVGGKCNENAVVHIKGGLSDMTYRPDDDNFMGVTSISSSGVTILTVTAQESGKAESLPITITVRARSDVNIFERQGIYGVIVGNDYQGHFLDALDDYIGANLFTDNQKEFVRKNIQTKVDYLKSNGLNAELIYLLIPNPMNIYPETVPTEYTRYTEDSRTKQFAKIAEDAGAKVIDLTDVFLEHRYDEYKLFHKTDSHWSHYGAYFGYRELFNYISKKWSDAAPRAASEFEFYHKIVDAGDMAVHNDIDMPLLKEKATFVKFNWKIKYNPEIYINDHSNLLTHDLLTHAHPITQDTTNKQMPKAIILRDSFGTPVYSMLTDGFGEAYWQDMWNYSFDTNLINNYKPDYYIYVITERNIKNIMQ